MSADTAPTVAIAAPVSLSALRMHLDRSTTLPSGLGGASPTRIVLTLLRRGRCVHVVTLSRDVAPGTTVQVRGPRLRVTVGPYRTQHRARDAFRVERAAVAEALRAAPADVTHAHWSYEFALGALAADPDAVVTFRDWAPTVLRYYPTAYRLVRLGMQARVLRRARHLTAVSPYLRDAMSPWTRQPVHVVPNGLTDRWFDTPPREPDLRRPTIVAVNAGFDRRKNVGTLLAAMPVVRAHLPGARLLLVGPGHGTDEQAHRWARERGLDDGVAFQGAMPPAELRSLIAGAELLVHPSREETFGNVVIEAMSQRLPTVGGARSGAVPWVLDQGRAGVLVDVEDPEAVAAAIVSTCGDRERWHALSEAGYRRAREAFHMSAVVDGYERVYRLVAR